MIKHTRKLERPLSFLYNFPLSFFFFFALIFAKILVLRFSLQCLYLNSFKGMSFVC